MRDRIMVDVELRSPRIFVQVTPGRLFQNENIGTPSITADSCRYIFPFLLAIPWSSKYVSLSFLVCVSGHLLADATCIPACSDVLMKEIAGSPSLFGLLGMASTTIFAVSVLPSSFRSLIVSSDVVIACAVDAVASFVFLTSVASRIPPAPIRSNASSTFISLFEECGTHTLPCRRVMIQTTFQGTSSDVEEPPDATTRKH
mmetsp:Transcript_4111/g.7161  ORF Transcript_4111/g.7161 Transcript_4111/m.7161 type:complete len:201 (+) Transcript_4111:430-1032(+)